MASYNEGNTSQGFGAKVPLDAKVSGLMQKSGG